MTRRYMAPVVLVMVMLLSAVPVSAQTKEGVIALAVRVSGGLVPGSLARDASGLGISFAIADAHAAEGKVDAQGTFAATSVLAKCPSRLESAPPDEHDYAAS